MHPRWNSIESGSFFFQPAQLHLEPADLLVQLRNQGVLLLGVVAATVREQLRRALHALREALARPLGGQAGKAETSAQA